MSRDFGLKVVKSPRPVPNEVEKYVRVLPFCPPTSFVWSNGEMFRDVLSNPLLGSALRDRRMLRATDAPAVRTRQH